MQKTFKVLILSLISFTFLVFVIFSAFSVILPEVRGFLQADLRTINQDPAFTEIFEFGDTVKDIYITSTDFTVSIHSSDSDHITMVLSGTNDDSHTPEYSASCVGGTLSLELSEKNYGGLLDLYLPLSMRFSSINIQNIYSSVNLYGPNVSEININNVFGDVYASDIHDVSSFRVTTLTGQIHIANCTIASLECESDSGPIVIESRAEILTAKSDSGKIQFAGDSLFSKADLQTESGDIELVFPPESNFIISYFNKYGSVIYKDFTFSADGNILACTNEDSVPVPISIKTDYGNVYIYSSTP